MSPLLKSLLGNGSRDRELTDEMRAIVNQMQAKHDHYEDLVASSADNSPEAQSYLPPIATGPYGLGPERHLDLVRRVMECPTLSISWM